MAGYPVVDLKVTLYDGTYHDVDSSDIAFKIAGAMAFKEAFQRAKPIILEPIMKVEVLVPNTYLGEVIGDLNSRRGKIMNTEMKGNMQVINATVPLSEMFGYSTRVRSLSQGRASYNMEFNSYEVLSENLLKKVINK